MTAVLDLLILKGVVCLLVGLAVTVVVYGAVSPDGFVRNLWHQYVALYGRYLEFLFIDIPASRVAMMHLAFLALLLCIGFVFSNPVFFLLLVPCAYLPFFLLKRKRVERITRIEQQLDGWLVVLANALRASPSLGEAVETSSRLMHPPLSQELDLVVKRQRLGVPLDEALAIMAERVKSQSLNNGVLTLMVARQSGGNLPATLETTASTLREMARLEGVVRTKTAEGKNQAYVLAVIPLFLVFAIHWISPGTLNPLVTTGIGYVLSAVALVLWIGSFFVARKILAVDI